MQYYSHYRHRDFFLCLGHKAGVIKANSLAQPNLYVPIAARELERKIELLNVHFGSRRSKDRFDPEVFRGLARLRGMECRAQEGYAEAFFARKVAIV